MLECTVILIAFITMFMTKKDAQKANVYISTCLKLNSRVEQCASKK